MAKKHDENEEMQEYEVLEMEADDGESAEFIVLERFEHESKAYVLLLPFERAQELSEMNEAEWNEQKEDFEGILIMRVEDESYFELSEEEIEAIQPTIDTLFGEA
ncbi:MAG: DUF1292 domain-containing protein [Acidobacteria bacterium]|nr:DUF1292 domain-containing protein [Acidobacteriota bacterium]MCB9397430.1 DUF1292 domain-containing protein [Acidobacteriota bacterium]